MSDDVAMPEHNAVPDLLDKAAVELERKDRQLEIMNAQLGIIEFVDRLLQAGAFGQKGTDSYGVASVADQLRQRAKEIRRVTK